MKKRLIFALTGVLACFAIALASSALLPKAPSVAQTKPYALGSATVQAERLEVEQDGKEGKLTTPSVGNRCNFVSGQILESSSSGGSMTYEVNLEQAGTYVVKLAYFTGMSGTELIVCANDGAEVRTGELTANGWATAGEVWTYYANVEVELKQGKNKLFIKQAPVASGESKKYVNLDFIELYKKGDVFYYPIESKLYPELAGNWEVGERIEAEWMTYSGSVAISGVKEERQNYVNHISGQISQLNSYTASFAVNAPSDGRYAMKLCYLTGSNNASMAFDVAVGGGAVVTSDPLYVNGWTSDANIVPFLTQIEIELARGVNTLTVKQNKTSGYYINFDYVEIYPIDEVPYSAIERNLYPELAGGNPIGARIEAEHGVTVETTGRSYQEIASANVSGSLMWKGASPLRYSVYAEEAGEYYLQIVNYCAGTLGAVTQMQYDMTIGGKDYSFTDFALSSYEQNGGYIQSAQYFTVELKQGLNEVLLNGVSGTKKMHTDFFCFFPKTDMIDEVLQAEHYAVGATKVIKSHAKYPEIDEFATEFVSGKTSTVVLRPKASEAGYYDLFVRAWSGAGCGFDLSVNGGEKTFYPTKNSGWVSQGGLQAPKDNVYRVYLEQGENVLTFSKNSSCYVDLDWIYLTKEKVTAECNAPDGFRISVNQTLPIASVDFTVRDEDVARVENGAVTGLKGGETELVFACATPNGHTYERVYKLYVEKILYEGDDLLAPDLTVGYNGAPQTYSGASAPQGWRIAYNVDATLVTPGTVNVIVKFSHDVYGDVYRQATFTVEKGTYAGGDLVAHDVTGTFDGTTRYFVQATAPEGWEIAYSTNGRTVKGVTEVKVVFTHAYYETVVKTVYIRVS